MTSLKQFEFAFGIGRDLEFLEPVRLVHQLASDIDPFYLISCDGLVSETGAIKELPSRIALPDHVKRNRLMLDSAGYSILSGNRSVMSLPAEVVADLCNDYEGPLCISADAPSYFNHWPDALWVNRTRLQIFHARYRPRTSTLVYDAIHGEYDEDKRFTLRYRANWCKNMARYPEIKPDGYALRLPAREAGMKAQAYFAMQPWSYGTKMCHLLVAGGITYFPLLVYIAENCYQHLSCDAKSHTIDATENLIARIPDEFGIPRAVELSREKHKPEKLRSCQCKICEYFEETEKTTLKSLADENLTGGKQPRSKVLTKWIVSHNIYVIESYIDKLRKLVKDKSAFLQFLSDTGMRNAIEAIEFVDQLLVDRDQYADNIRLLAYPQKKGLRSF